MSHICREGACAVSGSRFPTIRGLRTHRATKHSHTAEKDSSLGKARALKRKFDEDEEEERKRRQLQAQLALEATNHDLDAELQRPVCFTVNFLEIRSMTHILQVPLLERTINTELQRSGRARRLPVRFRDLLPSSAVPAYLQQQCLSQERQSGISPAENELEAATPPLDSGSQHDDVVGDQTTPETLIAHTTNTNSIGLFRKYFTIPSHSPLDPDAFADIPTATANPQPQGIGSGLTVAAPAGPEHNPLTESKSQSGDMLLSWGVLGSGNTPAGMNDLVHNVLLHPNFNLSELKDFNAITETRRFNQRHLPKSGATLKPGDGWREGSVKIRVPCRGVKQKEEDAPEFVVDGILYRDVVEVITAELEDPDAFDNIHTTPYEEWWYPCSDAEPVRVYSETYNSDAMLEADKEMRENLRTAGDQEDDREIFVVSALLYSDSTHLASFGTASLWPIYLFLGNVSKYIRSKPTSSSAHHIAYIPKVCYFPSLMWLRDLRPSHSFQTPSKSSIKNTMESTPPLRCSRTWAVSSHMRC